MIEEGVTGFLVPPNDAEAMSRKVLLLAEDPGLRSRLALAARERVNREFHQDVYRKTMYAVYDEMQGRVAAEQVEGNVPECSVASSVEGD